tara:strand:+ start:49089 stop:49442 length:354 start_codon:yes stop_codon:yes gene_type:complete
MLMVNVVGVALIAVIVWWFWLYKPSDSTVSDSDTVILIENGVYSPSRISLPAKEPSVLHFLRKDASLCSEVVVLPDLEISVDLPLDQLQRVDLPALEKGEYDFHCQMKMYRGVIKVT